MKTGIELITEERTRQIEVKGWTLAHDDGHTAGELPIIAAKCACDGTDARVEEPLDIGDWNILKRHGHKGEEPDAIHLLAVAGALIAAEIDRLQRRKEPWA